MHKCPYCYQHIEHGVRVCIHCKADLTVKPESQKSIFQRAGFVFGILIFVGVLGYFTFTSVMGLGDMYERGHVDGLGKSKNTVFYSVSQAYQRGFDKGASMLWYFDMGCDDKMAGSDPQYPDVPKYLEGYDSCESGQDGSPW